VPDEAMVSARLQAALLSRRLDNAFHFQHGHVPEIVWQGGAVPGRSVQDRRLRWRRRAMTMAHGLARKAEVRMPICAWDQVFHGLARKPPPRRLICALEQVLPLRASRGGGRHRPISAHPYAALPERW
jgi:hypothetical protein